LIKHPIPLSHLAAARATCGTSLRFNPLTIPITARITSRSFLGTATHQSGRDGCLEFCTPHSGCPPGPFCILHSTFCISLLLFICPVTVSQQVSQIGGHPKRFFQKVIHRLALLAANYGHRPLDPITLDASSAAHLC
jgi:hypothetical protein